MSLIICYVGSRGTVIIGDKRRIGFLGDEKRRELLEEELYSGSLKTQEQMMKRAAELGINLKITDDSLKVHEIGEVLVGEVRFKTPFETKRKRIYATTGSYSIIELLGSKIKKINSGNTSIIVFGNKITKEMANKFLKKHWKEKINLELVGKIFEQVMIDVAQLTPSVSHEYDLLIKNPSLTKKQSREIIRSTIIQEVKELEKWRDGLKEQMLKTARNIQMASKIMNQGEVGIVMNKKGKKVAIKLFNGVEALDLNWEILAQSGEIITMDAEQPEKISIGDLVVIEDENLCVQRNKSNLHCKFILCKSDNKSDNTLRSV